MRTINVVISGINIEEIVKNTNRLDYYEIAMSLLYTGTQYQRKCINVYMQTLKGIKRTEAIKEFIDMEILIGRLEV